MDNNCSSDIKQRLTYNHETTVLIYATKPSHLNTFLTWTAYHASQFIFSFFKFFCLSHVVDKAGYTSTFYCTLNTQYVSYRKTASSKLWVCRKPKISSDSV